MRLRCGRPIRGRLSLVRESALLPLLAVDKVKLAAMLDQVMMACCAVLQTRTGGRMILVRVPCLRWIFQGSPSVNVISSVRSDRAIMQRTSLSTDPDQLARVLAGELHETDLVGIRLAPNASQITAELIPLLHVILVLTVMALLSVVFVLTVWAEG